MNASLGEPVAPSSPTPNADIPAGRNDVERAYLNTAHPTGATFLFARTAVPTYVAGRTPEDGAEDTVEWVSGLGTVPYAAFVLVLLGLLAVGHLVAGLSTVAGVLASLVAICGVGAYLGADLWS